MPLAFGLLRGAAAALLALVLVAAPVAGAASSGRYWTRAHAIRYTGNALAHTDADGTRYEPAGGDCRGTGRSKRHHGVRLYARFVCQWLVYVHQPAASAPDKACLTFAVRVTGPTTASIGDLLGGTCP